MRTLPPQTSKPGGIGLSPDIVVECTGVLPLIQQAADAVAPGGIVCLTGVGSPSTSTSGPASALATDAVLKNLVMLGSVNANRRHYYRAAKVLANTDRSWLEQLLTRRVRPDDVDQALARTADDIKVVMEFKQS
jgi:threonine dehydrogenase-like Zn-dependent dehydrogenase